MNGVLSELYLNTSTILKPTPLAFSSGGRVVGRFVRDERGLWLLKTRVDPARHMLRKPPAFATDATHLAQLHRIGGAGVRLILKTGEVLEARLADFEAHGFDVNRGHGPQIALPLSRWRRPGDRRHEDSQRRLDFDGKRGAA